MRFDKTSLTKPYAKSEVCSLAIHNEKLAFLRIAVFSAISTFLKKPISFFKPLRQDQGARQPAGSTNGHKYRASKAILHACHLRQFVPYPSR